MSTPNRDRVERLENKHINPSYYVFFIVASIEMSLFLEQCFSHRGDFQCKKVISVQPPNTNINKAPSDIRQ